MQIISANFQKKYEFYMLPTINKRFKKIREEHRFTQELFAEKLNVKRVNISDLERFKTYPNPTILENLHLKFNINLNWLLCGTGKMKVGLYDNENSQSIAHEPQSDYRTYKDRYIDVLEEVNELRKELEWYRINCKCKK